MLRLLAGFYVRFLDRGLKKELTKRANLEVQLGFQGLLLHANDTASTQESAALPLGFTARSFRICYPF